MLRSLTICALSSLALSACARNIVTIPPARCADLIPSEWADPVPGEALPPVLTPSGAADAAAWRAAAIAWSQAFAGQTGQLGKANGRTADAIGIMRRCEAMVNAARPDQRKP